MYKLNKKVIIKKFGEDYFLLKTNKTIIDFSSMYRINEITLIILSLIEDYESEELLIKALKGVFKDKDEEELKTDLKESINYLLKEDLIVKLD